MSKENTKKSSKVPIIIISIIVTIAIFVVGANLLSYNNLLKKGSEYSKVQYENQLVPEKDENGNWYFTQGMPSRPFMYETSMELMNLVVKTAREVFK